MLFFSLQLTGRNIICLDILDMDTTKLRENVVKINNYFSRQPALSENFV
jgi:hypothetical protein